MTSRSKLGIVLAALLGAALMGCGSGDSGTGPEPVKADPNAPLVQQGAGGKKAAAGGGVADTDIVPAKPGEPTGGLQPGRK